MLTITENSDEEQNEDDGCKEEKKGKRIVMVMARQHPGESPSSYVVQGESLDKQIIFITQIFSGLIDFLVSKHKIAKQLRQKLIFKVMM